jgi:glycosyltransferase family protein
VGEYVKELKKIWDGKDVVIVEGEKSRLGVGNDLFDNMNSIQRVICPAENAFEIYDRILNELLKLPKDKLILLALGPTATVLAYDMYKAGYHVIDIGHVDIEYEWFLRKATKKIKIENKYVTEVKEGRVDIQDIKDSKYQNEIIERIL